MLEGSARHSDARPASQHPSHSSGERSGTCKPGREGFCFIYHQPEQTFTGCWPALLPGRGCPDPQVPHPGEATRAALSQQQGGSGSAVEAPHGALTHLPTRSSAVLQEYSCISSVDRPYRGAQFPAVPAAGGKSPPDVVPSGVDPSHFIPRANPSAVGWPPQAPRAHPRSWGRDGPAGLRQLRSAETPPRQGLQLATASLIRTGLWSNSAVPGAELTPELGFLVRGPLGTRGQRLRSGRLNTDMFLLGEPPPDQRRSWWQLSVLPKPANAFHVKAGHFAQVCTSPNTSEFSSVPRPIYHK